MNTHTHIYIYRYMCVYVCRYVYTHICRYVWGWVGKFENQTKIKKRAKLCGNGLDIGFSGFLIFLGSRLGCSWG